MKNKNKIYSTCFCILLLTTAFTDFLCCENDRKDKISTDMERINRISRIKHNLSVMNDLFEKNPAKVIETGIQTLKISDLVPEEKSLRLKIMKSMFWAYKNRGNFEKSLEWANKTLKLAAALNKESETAQAHTFIAISYWRRNNYKLSLEHYQKALEIHKTTGNKWFLYESYNNIGAVYSDLGSYDLALRFYFRALKALDGFTGKDTANTLNRIGIVYYNLNKKKEALRYYKQALSIQKQLKDNTGYADTLNNIGVIYQEEGRNRDARNAYIRSMKIVSHLNNMRGRALGLNNIGETYMKENPEKAEQYFRDSLKLAAESGDRYGVSYTNINMGILYKQKKEYKKASELIKHALAIAEDIGARSLIKRCTGELSLLYAAEKKFREAYEYSVRFKREHDLIFNENSNRKIIEMQTRYDLFKKENTIELLNKERRIKNLELRKNELLRRGLFAGLFLVTALILLLLNRYIIKVRNNKEINNKNQKLREAYDQMLLIARTDNLTGLPNRRFIKEKLLEESNRFERNSKPFVLIMCDIDHFKNINDTYGHEAGDKVLRAVSKIMRSVIRKQDCLARWGGEEFLLLLPETPKEGGVILAEKLRELVAASPLTVNDTRISLSVTCGVSEFRSEQNGVDSCIKRADHALYKGKELGRNRVVRSEE